MLSTFTFGAMCLRGHPFAEQVAAVTGAGFRSIGLGARGVAEGRVDVEEVAEVVAAAEVVIGEVEAVRPWGDPAAAGIEAVALELCARFRPSYLQVCPPTGTDLAAAAASFARLCDAAAELDVTCGLEFLPFTDVRGPEEAAAIVREADRPNGGVCVDGWHLQRLGREPGSLAPVASSVVAVQVCDGPSRPVDPDPVEDCLRHRQVPGRGDFDVRGLVDWARSLDRPPHMAVEVMGAELDGLSAQEAAGQIAAGLEGVVGSSGGGGR